jgi:hypothetical protein
MMNYEEALKAIAELMAEKDISLREFDALEQVADTLTCCRNELCSWCGAYEYFDACTKCKWR